MQLAKDVYDYYNNNKDQLSEDKLFHFATRTAAWLGKKESMDLLRDLRKYIIPEGKSLEQIIRDVYSTPQTGRRNAHELRQPFFRKYPKLYGAHLALFRVRHLKEVYGIDAIKDLYKVISKEELSELRNSLLADTDAMRILSTFAINYIYLLDRVIFGDDESIDLDKLIQIGKSYTIRDKQDIQLIIYFYTHCIIGESNFYTREIPESSIQYYKEMLGHLEPLIKDNFNDINLDNKLEFLVCARICDYETNLYNTVYDECNMSISEEGTFLIDRVNKNAQSDRNDFIKSEHRNVLFIMSAYPYQPKPTRI